MILAYLVIFYLVTGCTTPFAISSKYVGGLKVSAMPLRDSGVCMPNVSMMARARTAFNAICDTLAGGRAYVSMGLNFSVTAPGSYPGALLGLSCCYVCHRWCPLCLRSCHCHIVK